MGFKRCSVRGCFSEYPGSSKAFFLSNAKHRDSGRWKAFTEREDPPENCFICEDHFQPVDFINPNCKSQGLRKFVVPSRKVPAQDDAEFAERIDNEPPAVSNEYFGKDDFESQTYPQPNLDNVVGEMEIDSIDPVDAAVPILMNAARASNRAVPISADHDYIYDPIKYMEMADRMLKLEMENKQLKNDLRTKSKGLSKKQRIINELRAQIKTINLENASKKSLIDDPILKELQENKRRKSRGGRYSDRMKNLAIILHYCSKKAYKQMRQIFALPSLTSIHRWLSGLIVKEGFSATILQLLKVKSNFLPPEEKLVQISFDEIILTENVSYFGNARPDYFRGFKTRLPGQTKIDISVRARTALVVMIKSIRSGFKQAIGYFFCKDLKSSELKNIILEAIKQVFDAGLVPKALVCDQNSVNRALYKKEFKVTEQSPFLEYEHQSSHNRIYCFYDAPHLYKSTRNNLLKHNAVYGGGVCSFEHIVQLYHEDVPRTVPNLTYEHINLAQFAEMNVSKAAQTLSWSCAFGLRAYALTGRLPQAVLATASYCEDFDKLFDLANSSHFNTTKTLKRPLQDHSEHWEFMAEMVQKLRSLRYIDKHCYDLEKEKEFDPLPKQSRKPYFIDGWILYISALKMLWSELSSTHGFKFLRTRNISQDVLEHFFSAIRYKNGHNNHPDPSLFASAYKALIVNHLIIPEKVGNVEADVSQYIVNRQELSKIQIVQEEYKRPHYQDTISEKPTLDEHCDANQLASIHWTTGWVCSKLRHDECKIRAAEGADKVPDEATFLADFKKYRPTSKINTPGEKIFTYFQGVCSIFKDHFEPLLQQDTVGVKQELMELIQSAYGFNEDYYPELDQTDSPKFLMDVLCLPCALRVTDKYLNMLISCKLGDINEQFTKDADSKKKSKKTDKAKKLNISYPTRIDTSVDERRRKKLANEQLFQETLLHMPYLNYFSRFRSRTKILNNETTQANLMLLYIA